MYIVPPVLVPRIFHGRDARAPRAGLFIDIQIHRLRRLADFNEFTVFEASFRQTTEVYHGDMPAGGAGRRTVAAGAKMAVALCGFSSTANMVKAAIFLLLFTLTNASLLLLYPYKQSRLAIVAAIYATGTIVMLYFLFHPRNQWLVRNRSWVDCGRRPCVALTFDDGPSPTDTPRLLDILREKNVKATFFVVGERAEQYPEIVRRTYAEGHLVGNHTWSHPSLFCFLTPARLRSEIERGENSVEKICGFRPRYFRSPVGLRHPLLELYLKEEGLEYISWRLRTWDTFGFKSRDLTSRILNKVVSGDIILLHDRLASGAGAMLNALPGIIDELRRRGFDFVLAGDGSPVQAKVAAEVQ
jgi:peptidoglycan/xylan/chitin deacetylase (PgdA/CDA1 family)